ncbi:MAG: hypothetical protein IJQ99_06595 [Synergistaceae bacterium]|nr:hypothetical protein [Synergistaceae bacterium]
MSSLEVFMIIAFVFWCCIVPFSIIIGFASGLKELLKDIIFERRECRECRECREQQIKLVRM